MAEGEAPTEEELLEALDRVAMADILVQTLTATASLGFRRVSPEARDLAQARLAIEALRALEPVLREGGVDDALIRDLEQARREPSARVRKGGRPRRARTTDETEDRGQAEA